MKNRCFALSICLLIVGMTLEGCHSFGKSSIVGQWQDIDMGIIWTFSSDGSFREEPASSLLWNMKSKSGRYNVKGKRLILDTDKGGEHYEFNWRKSDKDHLTFGNDAGGYWNCERLR